MANKFDPYRDVLVIETKTIWPAEVELADAAERRHIEAQLHADPQPCSELEYVRLAAGFCRQITVTQEDLERWRNTSNTAQA